MDTFLSPDIFDFFGPPGALWMDKNAKNPHENADVYATRLARRVTYTIGVAQISLGQPELRLRLISWWQS